MTSRELGESGIELGEGKERRSEIGKNRNLWVHGTFGSHGSPMIQVIRWIQADRWMGDWIKLGGHIKRPMRRKV